MKQNVDALKIFNGRGPNLWQVFISDLNSFDARLLPL